MYLFYYVSAIGLLLELLHGTIHRENTVFIRPVEMCSATKESPRLVDNYQSLTAVAVNSKLPFISITSSFYHSPMRIVASHSLEQQKCDNDAVRWTRNMGDPPDVVGGIEPVIEILKY
jgi:hypothetical protein